MRLNPKRISSVNDRITQLIRNGNVRSFKGRFNRLKFLLSFEEHQKQFPTPTLACEYYEEARLCWYAGAFVATIVMVQLAFEELLRSHYRVVKGVGGRLNCGIKVDQASFSNLINEAKNNEWISEEETKLLHNLRKNIRNPCVHVKDIRVNDKGKPNLKKPNFFVQYLKIKTPGVISNDVENEAREAVQLLITLFPKMSSRYGGL